VSDATELVASSPTDPAARQPSSIERIQRLERLERQRIEDKDRKQQRRAEVIAGEKPLGGRHDLCDRIEDLTKYPMAVLGVAWLVVAIVVVTTKVDSSTSIVLVGTLFVLWTIVLVEYLVRLVVTPDTRGYVKRRWAEPVTVAVPAFQGWHLIGIEKVTLVIHEGALRVEAILKHHSLFRVLIAAAGTLFLGAWLVMLFEQHQAGSNIHNYPDALWWAIVTVTTVGYGDRFPTSGGGRTVAVVLMLVGIGLIGVLTATVASVFVAEHTDKNREVYREGHRDLGQQLAVIASRLADVERRLGATDDDIAATDATGDADAAANGPLEPGDGASTS
jgi:voltage-gated potassium channel